jgi:acid phosphatase
MIKRRIKPLTTLLALYFILSLTCSTVFAVEPVLTDFTPPKNMQASVDAINHYVKEGKYTAGLNQIGKKALEYLMTFDNNLDYSSDKPPAIVFDIDETCLSNYAHLKAVTYGYNTKSWSTWLNKGEGTVIQPSLTLFNQAKKMGIAIFLISMRPDNFRQVTIKNMNKIGYSGWTTLYLPDATQAKGLAQDFKAPKRKQISEKYNIILNIGDQFSDLTGGYAEKTFKYPDPFYFVP